MSRTKNRVEKEDTITAILAVMEEEGLDLSDLEDEDENDQENEPIVKKPKAKVKEKSTTMHQPFPEKNIENSYQRALERHPDEEGLARQLFRDNFTQREQIRELQDIFTEDNVAALKEWLGDKKPSELKTLIEQAKTVAAENKSLKNQKVISDVCKYVAPGIEFNPEVLQKLLGDSDFDFETKETTDKESGQKVKHSVVKFKEGDTTKEQPLLEYAKEKFDLFMPSLLVRSSSQREPGNFDFGEETDYGTAGYGAGNDYENSSTGSSNGNSASNNMGNGIPFPSQVGNGNAAKKTSLAGNFGNSRYGHNAPNNNK
jgi:hypothetical protein